MPAKNRHYRKECRRRQMKTHISIIMILVAAGCTDEKELHMLSNSHNNLLNEHKETKVEIKTLNDANAKLERKTLNKTHVAIIVNLIMVESLSNIIFIILIHYKIFDFIQYIFSAVLI